MTSPTVHLDERFMMRPEYETRNYDFATAGRTLDLGASKLLIDSVAMTSPAAELMATDPSSKVTVFDDFTYLTYDPTVWADGEGSDTTGAIGPTIVANALGGRVLATSGDANSATTTVDTSGISSIHLSWTTANGGLAMETRLEVNDITNCSVFVGFTDRVVADGTTEMPIDASGSGDVIDQTATDAAGIIFDTEFATSPTFFNLGAVSGGSVATVVVGTKVPVNDVFQTFRVEITAARTVQAWVDGVSIGTIATALADVALTPVVLVRGRTTAVREMTVDYVWCQQNR